jgi:hypothetical protein
VARPIFAGLFGEEEGNGGSQAPVGAAVWAFNVLAAAKLQADGLPPQGNEFTHRPDDRHTPLIFIPVVGRLGKKRKGPGIGRGIGEEGLEKRKRDGLALCGEA